MPICSAGHTNFVVLSAQITHRLLPTSSQTTLFLNGVVVSPDRHGPFARKPRASDRNGAGGSLFPLLRKELLFLFSRRSLQPAYSGEEREIRPSVLTIVTFAVPLYYFRSIHRRAMMFLTSVGSGFPSEPGSWPCRDWSWRIPCGDQYMAFPRGSEGGLEGSWPRIVGSRCCRGRLLRLWGAAVWWHR